MQYLLKLTLEGTTVWRLVALDGRADLAHAALLIENAFGYAGGRDAFEIQGKIFPAGCGGRVEEPSELRTLDESLGENSGFSFTHETEEGILLKHVGNVMRCEEKLFCLIPSVIVGAGCIPKTGDLTVESIQEYADRDENLTLNIKEATSAMRAVGSFRSDVSEALVGAGASPLNFKHV